MKRVIILSFFLIGVVSAFAQTGDRVIAVSYPIGFATGDLNDYMGKASFRGIGFDYREMVHPGIGVGVDIGWNIFYDARDYDTYEYDNLTFSGKQYRYSNHVPMLAAMSYYIKPEGKVVGYGGFGLGIMYSQRNTDMGTYTFERSAWQFAIRPELGMLINTSPGFSLMVGTKYYYGVKAGDFEEGQGYFTLNLGLVFGN